MIVKNRAGRKPDLALEYSLRYAGYENIVGIDEAGRGALAGPVVAAAVVLPLSSPDLTERIDGIRDSKKMNLKDRKQGFERIHQIALKVTTGTATHAEVDRMGIIPATHLAMRRAIQSLSMPVHHLLIDHLTLPEISIPQIALSRGDDRILSIAAASVIAKVERDRAMDAMGERFPGYGFSRHKGYGTEEHREALQHLGPCSIHRRTFAPIRQQE
jgi:ribonuclease HII